MEGKKYVGFLLVLIALIYLISLTIQLIFPQSIGSKYCFLQTPSGNSQLELISPVSLAQGHCDTNQNDFYLTQSSVFERYVHSGYGLIASIIFLIVGGLLLRKNEK